MNAPSEDIGQLALCALRYAMSRDTSTLEETVLRLLRVESMLSNPARVKCADELRRHLERHGGGIAKQDARAAARMIALVDAWGDEHE